MSNPRRPVLLVLFFLVLVLVSASVAILAVRLIGPTEWSQHDEPHGHQWLHHELQLTDAEAARIDTFERPYRTARERLQEEFDERVQAIATLLKENDSATPEVTHAIHDLHRVHGALQQLAIEHYFDMLSVLPPDKQARLRNLAVEALSTPQ